MSEKISLDSSVTIYLIIPHTKQKKELVPTFQQKAISKPNSNVLLHNLQSNRAYRNGNLFLKL